VSLRLVFDLHGILDLWLSQQRVDALYEEERGQVILDDDGSLYLIRVYLVRVMRRVLPGLFIHRFCRSDHDRELHNHPWDWAVALVLTGGYVEERKEGLEGRVTKRTLRPLSLNLIRSSTFHRVQLLDEEAGAWTLFLAGPRATGGWGFLDPDTLHYEDAGVRSERLKKERARAA